MTDPVTSIAAALQAARERSALGIFLGQAELYCRNSDCSVREVILTIKEHDGPTTPADFGCPVCRRPLKLHHVLTLEESDDDFERAARISVNEQLYRLRTGSDAIPIKVLLDDSLPPDLTSLSLGPP